MMNNLKNIALQSERMSYHTNQFGAGGLSLGDNMQALRCKNCGKKIYTPKGKDKKTTKGLCVPCIGISRRGSGNTNWKGGRVERPDGYIQIHTLGYPLANERGYILEHRLVAAEHWGIFSVMDMHVHHINGDRADNRIENLELLTHGEHSSRTHRKENSPCRKMGEENPFISCECGCGKTFLKFNKNRMPRRFLVGHRNRKNV